MCCNPFDEYTVNRQRFNVYGTTEKRETFRQPLNLVFWNVSRLPVQEGPAESFLLTGTDVFGGFSCTTTSVIPESDKSLGF